MKNMKFSHKVLEKAKEIPKGKVTTYKLLAKVCARPNAARAVGNALNKNRFSYLENISESRKIPCHRVVNSTGKIGGFSKGIEKKVVLLKSEGVEAKNKRILNFKDKLFKF